ncbi:MAG: MarR family transcriptional regulator [Caldilineaceae bacterium]|nr:MarR family transcriptional regulator [Caldilineaceae bacterium]
MANHDFQEKMIALVRAFGWHRPAETPCGQPVTIAEAHALLEIARADGISQNELTVSLNLAKSTVSRLISKIEHRGWVVRQPHEQDRRAYRLFLTPKGSEIAQQLAQARQSKMDGILAQIPVGQRDDVLKSLDLLVKAIQAGETDEILEH